MSARKAELALTALALGLAGAGPALADRPDGEQGTFSLVVENDSLSSGADRNYTSGIKLSYTAPAETTPFFLKPARGVTRAITGSSPTLWGFGLGQSLFTPEDIEASPAPADEHPYAGYLYVHGMVAAEDPTPGREPAFIDVYEIELGIVGPGALGEQSQRGIHQALGAPIPNGWDQQLKDEPVVALTFERRWRARRFLDAADLEFDFSPGAAVTVGNLRTQATAGFAARMGQGLDFDFGPPRVRPGLAGASHFLGARGVSWYVFGGVDGRAVARNIFLDGNTWKDSPSVEKNPFVLDAQLGVAVQAGDVRLVYTAVGRTEEFESQRQPQDFGSLSFSWRF